VQEVVQEQRRSCLLSTCADKVAKCGLVKSSMKLAALRHV